MFLKLFQVDLIDKLETVGKGGMSNLRVSQPKRRLCIVGVRESLQLWHQDIKYAVS